MGRIAGAAVALIVGAVEILEVCVNKEAKPGDDISSAHLIRRKQPVCRRV